MTRAKLEEVKAFLERATVELDQRISQADSRIATRETENLTGDELLDVRHQRYATQQLSYAIYNVNCDLRRLLNLQGTERDILEDELLVTEET